jgi:hypothetical protein
MKKGSLLLLAVGVGICTIALNSNGDSPELATERQELHARADVIIKAADCRKRGFQPNQATGECTDIPLPALLR